MDEDPITHSKLLGSLDCLTLTLGFGVLHFFVHLVGLRFSAFQLFQKGDDGLFGQVRGVDNEDLLAAAFSVDHHHWDSAGVSLDV